MRFCRLNWFVSCMNQSMDRVLGRYNPDSSEEDEKEPMHRLQQLYILPAPGIAQPHAEPPPGLETPTPTKPLIASKLPSPKPPLPSFNIPKIFPRRSPTRSASADMTSYVSPPAIQSIPTSDAATPTPPSRPALASPSKTKFRKSWGPTKQTDYNFSAANDIMGIVMLEILGATDLPRLRNSALPVLERRLVLMSVSTS